ncbi:MAG: acyclic terpene utilization AtuA family protein [Candidatus Sericytochromatia bacterium]
MNTVRVASGLGFYGDSWQPVKASIERGGAHYVCSDHLAELTLAILQKDRLKHPESGYTRDMVPMLQELLPLGLPRGVKFILNAGGLNPLGAQAAVVAALKRAGVKARVAAVTGDALHDRLDELVEAGVSFAHLDTGAGLEAVRDRLLFANAYLGAWPIVEALRAEADIVITGRVADAALFLAPLIHTFGWTAADLDRLAQGVVVGHLLECSGQASGGNFGGDWRSVPDLAGIGYPIAEVASDGTGLVTKAPGTGGRVSFDTLREQLLYEVHDPSRYLTPDVTVDLTAVRLDDRGGDEVVVTGARGAAAPARLKVVAGYHDGWMGQAMVGYAWPDALEKARAAAAIIEAQLGRSDAELHTEFVGHNSLHGPLADDRHARDLNEVYLRMAVRTPDKAVADRFGRLFPPLGLSGPPFVGGYGGLTPPRELLGIWPTLIAREHVEPHVRVHLEAVRP